MYIENAIRLASLKFSGTFLILKEQKCREKYLNKYVRASYHEKAFANHYFVSLTLNKQVLLR